MKVKGKGEGEGEGGGKGVGLGLVRTYSGIAFPRSERKRDGHLFDQTGGQVPRHAIFFVRDEEALESVVEGSAAVHDAVLGELLGPQFVDFRGLGVFAAMHNTIVDAACNHHQV